MDESGLMPHISTAGTTIDQEGSVLVKDFLSDAELRSAQEELATYYPRGAQIAADPDLAKDLRLSAGFPFQGNTLNHIATHPQVISLVENFLNTDRVCLGDAILQARYGPAITEVRDQRLRNEAWGRNSLVYPRIDGSYQRLFVIVYFTDVTSDLGPTCLVPHQLGRCVPLLAESGHAAYGPDEYPELYAAEQPVPAPAGAALFFTGRTIYRCSAIRDPYGERFAMFLNFHAAHAAWLDKQTWTGSPVSPVGPRVQRFIESATPRQRSVLGFPAPGDDYWTDETLRGVASLYPGMDLGAYRAACRPG